MRAYLYRSLRHDCFLGGLQFDSGFQCYILEPPWRNNEPDISCIPEGVYQCSLAPSKKWSPTPPLLYLLHGVPGRDLIRFHAGATVRDTLGCLITGNAVVEDPVGATFIRNSRKTLMALHEHTQGKPFTLTIASA